MESIEIEIPDQIAKNIAALVKGGWFRDEKDIYCEAIRRFLDSHHPDLMENFIREDIEWGLHGND